MKLDLTDDGIPREHDARANTMGGLAVLFVVLSLITAALAYAGN